MKYFPTPDEKIRLSEVNRAVEAAFSEHGLGNVQMPPKVYVTFPHGDFRTMPAYLPAQHIAGVKVVNVHPANPKRDLPTVMSLTIILDVDTGRPEAILNSTRLTDLRTGAGGAVAAKYLSPKKDVTLGLIGSGRQAAAQVEAIALELNVTGVRVWSRREEHSEAICKRFPGLDCKAVSIEKACDCDILVTTTPSRNPIVMNEWIHEGMHINAIGADAPGKEELDPAILRRALVFVDDPAQAVHSGEINVPVSRGLYSPGEIAGTLGEVVLGKKRRNSKDQITVFDSTGLGIQDLAIADIAMRDAESIDLPFP
ncbi:MAG: ornithine cyclodeaminase family protein [Methanoregulaceae archaeon]|nr:ornithine cyclodeaminase family protein [Methanoregulaceae archaeon]